MTEDPGLEVREALLPDGTEVVIVCAPGTPQDDIDLRAAQLWAEPPEHDAEPSPEEARP
ncbi:hypothetical protein ACGFSB_33660 [Streptomyces sp. NPDC048441]|uniref:hypothetical protein n=1 Tax=Streptomyces sp. NPDC048441 TaxID=3365552 RepID=UPI0037165617